MVMLDIDLVNFLSYLSETSLLSFEELLLACWNYQYLQV